MVLFFATLIVKSFSALNEEKSFVHWMHSSNNMFVGDEYFFRLGIFMVNQKYINEFNSHSSFSLGENHLMHLTRTEYLSMLGGKKFEEDHQISEISSSKADVPDSFDWRTKGVVNRIKDQGQCGSCWAFSCAGAMESQWAIKHGDLLSLSESNLVDCCSTCLGCNGCVANLAYSYVIKHQAGRFMLEKDYPYTPSKGHCNFDANKAVGKLVDYHTSKRGSEEELKVNCATHGPVSVLADASHHSFQLYSGGVYDNDKCTHFMLDHMMIVVGYGNDSGKDFWIVKNSWGTGWGEQGYIRMRRNHGDQCGIALNVIIPVVE